MAIIDPATEEEIGRLAMATRTDLDAALDAADKGFKVWREVGAFDRYQIMRKAANLLRERADSIGWLMTREQGKPLGDSVGEIMRGADTIDWFAEEARRTYGQVIPARAPGIMQMTVKLPIGPVAAFTPGISRSTRSSVNCRRHWRPDVRSLSRHQKRPPASPAELIRAFLDAGVPENVISLVYGVPAEISEYLIPHPTIRKISFTGSTPVGKHLAALAGLHMKRATMELGGHAPVMIFNDADIDNAIRIMAPFKTRNAGQVCISPTRFLVQDKVADQFTDGFIKALEKTKIGNGLDKGTEMGPMANERRIPVIEAMISDAKSKGANLASGGERIGNKGYFFQPTVLTDVPADATMMNEEPFGPVAIVNRFSTYEDAVVEANRLPFGLAAYAFTSSGETAQRLGQQVESGMLTINHMGPSLPEVPFGGIKDSAMAPKGGSGAVEAYLETRFVTTMA